MEIFYPYASMKDVQSTEEAFSPHPTLPNLNFVTFFYFFWVIFAFILDVSQTLK
jgi:hypothetical protein